MLMLTRPHNSFINFHHHPITTSTIKYSTFTTLTTVNTTLTINRNSLVLHSKDGQFQFYFSYSRVRTYIILTPIFKIPAELLSLPNLRNQRQLALAREQREETSRARQVDAQRALQKEMIKLQKEPLEGIRINLDDENILKWTAVIFGPPDTPYQGGYFKAVGFFS
jgi:hypothetical protein